MPHHLYPKPVALKFVMADRLALVSGELLHARFAHHPRIVRIDDVIELQGDPQWEPAVQVMVMQYGGRSLSKTCHALIRNRQLLPVEQLWEYIRHLVDGLKALHHDYQLVHRDISPRNLLIETMVPFTGEVASLACSVARLGDLGTAVPIGWSPVPALKQDGFKAPELISTPSASSEQIDPWIAHPAQDVFSLGKTLDWVYEFVAPPVPWQLGRLITNCLNPNPRDRPTAEDLQRELILQHPSGQSLLETRRLVFSGTETEDGRNKDVLAKTNSDLVKTLGSDDALQRGRAVHGLVERASRHRGEIFKLLLSVFDAPSPRIRLAAAAVLTVFQEQAQQAGSSLAAMMLAADQWTQELLQLASGPAKLCRPVAAALSQVPSRPVQPLIRALGARSAEVRQAAASILGYLDPPPTEALTALLSLTQGAQPAAVKSAAQQAVSRIW